MFGTLMTHSGKGRRARVGAGDGVSDIGWEATKEGSALLLCISNGRVAAHAPPESGLQHVIAT